MSIVSAETSLRDLLGMRTGVSLQSTRFFTENIRILHHFQTVTSLTLGSCFLQEVMHSYVAQTAWQQPHLMSMVLAVGSSDLKRLSAASEDSPGHQDFSIAESRHWQSGLKLYQSVLALPAGARNQSGDVFIATTFLSVICAFCIGDEVLPEVYSTAYNDAVSHALAPMAAASGISALRSAFRVFDTTAVWKAVIRDADDENHTYTCGDPGITGMLPAFVQLCGLDCTSTADNNKYHTILRHLTPLLYLKPSVKHFGKLIAFGGRTFDKFRQLLADTDHTALLLLSYWFALLRRLDLWWLNDRVSSECQAITLYLAKTLDPEIHALLPYPAFFVNIEHT